MAYRVKGFIRHRGGKRIRVAGFTRRKPRLTPAERGRRATRARTVLVPAAAKWVGKVGFGAARQKLAGKRGIRTPTRLAGYLKGRAKAMGVLSAAHRYKGRLGYRKHRIGGKKVRYAVWRKHQRRGRG